MSFVISFIEVFPWLHLPLLNCSFNCFQWLTMSEHNTLDTKFLNRKPTCSYSAWNETLDTKCEKLAVYKTVCSFHHSHLQLMNLLQMAHFAGVCCCCCCWLLTKQFCCSKWKPRVHILAFYEKSIVNRSCQAPLLCILVRKQVLFTPSTFPLK